MIIHKMGQGNCERETALINKFLRLETIESLRKWLGARFRIASRHFTYPLSLCPDNVVAIGAIIFLRSAPRPVFARY